MQNRDCKPALEEYLDFFFAVQGGAPPEHLAGNIDGATLEAFASLHGVQLMRRQKKANGVTKIIQSGIVDPILDNQVKLHDCASHDLFSGVQSLGASKTGCTLSPEFRGTSSSPQEFKPSCPQNNYNRASVGTAARSSERLPECLRDDVSNLRSRKIDCAPQADVKDALIGRKVVVVMLEELADEGEDGIVDVLVPGLHIGKVLQRTAIDKHDDSCPPGCAQRHDWFQVRIPSVTRNSRPRGGQAGAGGSKARRSLDVEVDLCGSARVNSVEALCELGAEAIKDAWMLLL